MARQAKILNLARLQQKLDRLPKVAKDLIRAEMGKAADDIVAMMKRQAPVLKEPHSKRRAGALRDSIGWTWGKAPKYAQVMAEVRSSMGGDLTITIYAGNSEVRYPHLVEFGTKKAAAQPFFYVSWRASRKSARRGVRKAVREAARQVASQN